MNDGENRTILCQEAEYHLTRSHEYRSEDTEHQESASRGRGQDGAPEALDRPRLHILILLVLGDLPDRHRLRRWEDAHRGAVHPHHRVRVRLDLRPLHLRHVDAL